jgi:hypothetical protein
LKDHHAATANIRWEFGYNAPHATAAPNRPRNVRVVVTFNGGAGPHCQNIDRKIVNVEPAHCIEK